MSYMGVCYRSGKNRKHCDTCEKETPKAHNRCKFYDPRKIPYREEQVCEGCGKTYHNWMSFMHHHFRCKTVFAQMVGKLIVNEDGSPVAINPKTFFSQEQTVANDETRKQP